MDNNLLYKHLDRLIPIVNGVFDFTINDMGPAAACQIFSISLAAFYNWIYSHYPDGKYGIKWSNFVIKWYCVKDFHRDDDLPAIIRADGYRGWYQFGAQHRDGDKPAAIYPNGMQEWYQFGVLHRDGGPAVIYADGSISWYDNGLCTKTMKVNKFELEKYFFKNP